MELQPTRGRLNRSLEQRLSAAGVAPGAAPHAAWAALRGVEGRRTTVIDLYELVARPRGMLAHELPRAERVELARSVMPSIWPGFTTTEDSDRSDIYVELAWYDPGWQDRYARWRVRLKERLGAAALRIEHVGSTAVPGLPAKPIVDIQVSVADLTDESCYVAQIEAVGLRLRSRDVYHRYFRPPDEQVRDVHIHVCAAGSQWEREHLLFRDYLRSDVQARRSYADVKADAAHVWADDRIAYTDAKNEVILDLLEAAQEWAASVGWSIHPVR